MQKLLAVLVMTSMVSITPTFAAELPIIAPTETTTVSEVSEPTMEPSAMTTESTTPELSAAPVPVVASMGSSLGEYKTVACSTNAAFSTNSCGQCFDGGSVKVGGDIN